MAYVDRPDPPPRLGFRSYADDTPRFEPVDEPAVGETRRTYEDEPAEWDDTPGLADAPGEAPPEPVALPSARRGPPAALLAAAAAIALGFVATAVVRWKPQQAAPPAAPAVVAAPPKVAVGADQPVESRVAPAPPYAPGPAAAAPGPPVTRAPAKSHLHAAPKRHGTVRTALGRAPARLDCERPGSYAQRMVCGSPTLMADDRRMSRAYAEALAAGAPPRRLRQDQAKWLAAREAAARRSKYAVASLYHRRIEDLESQPYRPCARASDQPGAVGVARWFLSIPGRIAYPGHRDCG